MNAKLVVAALAVTAVVCPSSARANCAAPTEYFLEVSGNTVTITPSNFQARACPDPEGMLRQNSATKEVVRLADYCAASDGGAMASYVDECVPAGDWRYGFAKPYDCEPSSCGTYYFVAATVTDALAPHCQRSAGNAAPLAASGAPWSDETLICRYAGGNEAGIPWDGASLRPDADQAARPLDAQQRPTDAASEVETPRSGCSTTSQGASLVFALNGLVLAAGLFAVRRSKAPRA